MANELPDCVLVLSCLKTGFESLGLGLVTEGQSHGVSCRHPIFSLSLGFEMPGA